jgi:hypothetical protein
MSSPTSIAELCQRVAHSRGPGQVAAAIFLNQALGENANLALTALLPILQAFCHEPNEDESQLVYSSVNAAGHICERADEQVDAALVEEAIGALTHLAGGPHIGVTHAAIYRLGKLGPRAGVALPTLEQIAGGGLSDDELKITRRARAYEALRLIDVDAARAPILAAARAEYLLACQGWLSTAANEGWTSRVEELQRRIEEIEREIRDAGDGQNR